MLREQMNTPAQGCLLYTDGAAGCAEVTSSRITGLL
jgi:hypothetical protein